jgi:hypothetical protein
MPVRQLTNRERWYIRREDGTYVKRMRPLEWTKRLHEAWRFRRESVAAAENILRLKPYKVSVVEAKHF